MPMLQWSARYSLNIREIDSQHQRLFALLNELYDAMQAGHGRTIVGDVLERLLDYTAYHFDAEETLFRAHGYPDEAAHRADHAVLTSRARALKRRFDAGELQVTSETLRFLGDWLNRHIVGTDRRYAPFLRACGVN